MVKLSIIIPAYNEEKRIARTLDNYSRFFFKYIKDYEIIAVLNGCRDNTLWIVKKFSKRNTKIKYLNFEEAIGKGGAILEGFKSAKGNLIGFVDADMATPPNTFYDLVRNIHDYDGIIASRWLKGSKINIKQPLLKKIGSRGFNFLVRLLFNLKFKDTQCGAKLFKNYVIKDILKDLKLTRWAFDVNLLYATKRKHYNIKEIPTEWNAVKASHFNLFKAIPEMFLGLIRLRLFYSRFKFIVKAYDKLPEFLKIHHRLR
ncbi:MAG: dolichyl-phosphate beta-glucosyltransferase [Nanoarchaeota archaeon]